MITVPELSAAQQRQLDETGFTSQGGGAFSKKFIVGSLLTMNLNSYFTQLEPTGRYMSELNTKAAEMDKIADAISRSANKMQDMARDSSKVINDASAKTRDSTEKLSAAMDKFMKIAMRPDFQQKLDSVESMVGALERLAKLEERGLLGRVFTTLGK